MGAKIVIVDYGMGNLYSVKNALDFIGADSTISSDVGTIEKADALLLPGVGAFPDASEVIYSNGVADILKEQCLVKGKCLLGICLGMQLLLDSSSEVKLSKGLGLIKGTCEKIKDTGLKIPHIGWNDLVIDNESPLLKNTKNGDYVYFVHSYKAVLENRENLVSHTLYGEEIPAIIQNGNIFGCQFHPEKSEKVGLDILRAFKDYIER